MQKPLSVIAALAVAATVALPVLTMAQAERVKSGTLTCDISGGIGLIITSHKEVSCMFTPSQPGPREVYVGAINKFGLDLGVTAGGEMVWAVYAPTTRRFGALAGNYGGALPRRRSVLVSAPMCWSVVLIAPSLCSRFQYKGRQASMSRPALPS